MNKCLEFKHVKNRSYTNDYRGNKKTSVRKLDQEQILGILDDVLSGLDKKQLINILIYTIENNCQEGSYNNIEASFRLEY